MPVRVRSRVRRLPLSVPELTRLTAAILRAARQRPVHVGVELVGDRRMRKLNRAYRRIDRSTDVLAFALREARGPRTDVLGDVVIAIPTAARQARRLGHSLRVELTTLLIHGILHLLGYDHERSRGEADRMRRKERAIFRGLDGMVSAAQRRSR